jgi:hypothetical protein
VPFLIYKLGSDQFNNESLKKPNKKSGILISFALGQASFLILLYFFCLYFQFLNSRFSFDIDLNIRVFILLFVFPLMLISQKSNFKAFSIINTFIKNKIIGTKNKLKIKALELIKYLVGLFYFGVAFTTLASILVWFTFLINFIWSIGDFYIPKNLVDNSVRFVPVISESLCQ